MARVGRWGGDVSVPRWESKVKSRDPDPNAQTMAIGTTLFWYSLVGLLAWVDNLLNTVLVGYSDTIESPAAHDANLAWAGSRKNREAEEVFNTLHALLTEPKGKLIKTCWPGARRSTLSMSIADSPVVESPFCCMICVKLC